MSITSPDAALPGDHFLAAAVDDAVAVTEAELYALGHGILAALRAGAPVALTITATAARSGYGELELTRTAVELLNKLTPGT
jgi:hypothetical protein